MTKLEKLYSIIENSREVEIAIAKWIDKGGHLKSGLKKSFAAELCGFTDRSAFQKKFKEKTGMTPTEFNFS